MINKNKNKNGDLSEDKEDIENIGGEVPFWAWQHEELHEPIAKQAELVKTVKNNLKSLYVILQAYKTWINRLGKQT